MDNEIKYRLTLKDFFKKTMLGAANDTKKLDSNMNKLDSTISKVGKGIAAYFAVGAIKDFGMQVVESLKNYEYFSASLRTLMYGDKVAAKALEGQLIKLASTTPFSLVDVQAGTKQLLAYGFETGKVVDNMKMLGDVASGVGAPLTDIIYLYGTLKTQGRAYTRDIMQFTSRGIPIIGLLAKQFHTTESEVQKLVEAGKVGFPQIERAFKTMTSEGGQFFGMMAEQSKTVGGQISNLGDSWTQLQVNIGKSQTGIINGTVSFLGQMTSALSKYFADANTMTENFAKAGVKDFGFWSKAAHEALGILTGYNFGLKSIVDQEKFQSNMALYTQPKNLQEAYQNKANLYKHSIGKDEEYKKGLIDKEAYDRFQATFKGALSTLEGNIKLLKGAPVNQTLAKEGLANADKNTGSSEGKSIGSSTEINGARPQNINITLDRLGDITIQTSNVTESAAQTREIFSKQLLELLNDANLIANR